MSGPEKRPHPFEEAFLHAHPNPDRIGCPGDEVLRGLASKELPISHPARIHIGQCSPCWREFRSFEARVKRGKRWTLVGGIAALLLILLLGPYLSRFGRPWKGGSLIALDLRSIKTARGTNQQHPVLHLPSTAFNLLITLPWGSEGGTYDVQLRTRNDAVVATARGKAMITDGDTSLRIDQMDLRNIPKGTYVMVFAHDSEQLKADVTVP